MPAFARARNEMNRVSSLWTVATTCAWSDASSAGGTIAFSDTYAVRTADGRYAKFSIVGYYCGEVRSGCFTIRYAYQGDGSRRLSH